eukprot:SAG31_NODE_915_length_11052_cov_26.254633_11_plen_182_part_00
MYACVPGSWVLSTKFKYLVRPYVELSIAKFKFRSDSTLALGYHWYHQSEPVPSKLVLQPVTRSGHAPPVDLPVLVPACRVIVVEVPPTKFSSYELVAYLGVVAVPRVCDCVPRPPPRPPAPVAPPPPTSAQSSPSFARHRRTAWDADPSLRQAPSSDCHTGRRHTCAVQTNARARQHAAVS